MSMGDGGQAMNMNYVIGTSAFFYEIWYREKVAKNLDKATKIKIARRISDLTLKRPLWFPDTYVEKSEVPELVPYSKNEKFTGIQLCVILTEITREFRAEIPSMSEVAGMRGG